MLRRQRPCARCGSTECGDSDFTLLGVPAWMIALGVIVAGVIADLAYTAVTPH